MLRTKIRRGGAIGLLLVLIVALLPLHVHAQVDDSITLGVSPQILDITANPGETVQNVFRLTNASDESVTIRTIPKNFTPRGEEGAVDLTEEKTTYSLADWITVNPQQTAIGAGKTQDFQVAIQVPANAEPGSHFGSVVFQTIPPEQEGSAALVSQEIAPVILVRIAGDTVESAEIVEFTASKGLYSNEKTIALLSRIRNTGNVHFKPTGSITIKNMFGSEVARLELDKRNVLPDSIRQFTTEWVKDGFKLGSYTATLTIVYGETSDIATAETSFIIFPYQVIVPIVLVIALLSFVIIKGRKRIVRAAKVLSGKDEAGK